MAICGIDGEKVPMMDTKRKLKSGESICNKHWKQAGLSFTDNPKEFTLADIQQRLASVENFAEKVTPNSENVSAEDAQTYGYLANKGLTDLDPDSMDSVKRISKELTGSGVTRTGIALSFTGNATDRLSLNFQNALVEQNWILIKQNQQIIELLKKDKKGD